jgi:cell division protein ZapA (FtsZ GTPase activity inhibitor)
MREVDKAASLKPVLKVAILAALNIADELFKEREEKADLIAQYESRIKELNESLSQALYEISE